jgi:ATP-dependent DNA helicase PIF1
MVFISSYFLTVVFTYHRLSMPEVVLDVTGANTARMSHGVEFLPTDLPENRRRLIRPAQQIDPLSTDIFLPDKWIRYLKRPLGAVFEDMTYMDFYSEFHEIFKVARGAIIPEPPYNNEAANPTGIYLDSSESRRKYRRYEQGKERCVRHKAMPMTTIDEACVHLLMLHLPTRMDCTGWKGHYGMDSYFAVAQQFLPQEVFESVVEPLGGIQVEGNMDNDVALDQEQTEIVNLSMDGNFRFIHGSAGTGKSTILRALCHQLRHQGRYEPIVLAPSGVAAKNVNGWTIHHFFGASASEKFKANLFALDWRIHLLEAQGKSPFFVIDEVSMCSCDMLDEIWQALSKVSRMPFLPMGGYRIAMFGDFGQLGPVVKKGEVDDERDWAWNSRVFRYVNQMELQTPHRQGNDNFFRFLEIVRRGPRSRAEKDFVQQIVMERTKARPDYDRMNVTWLTALRQDAKDINEAVKDAQIQEGLVTYNSVDNINCIDQQGTDFLERETGLVKKLVLWQGALVMVTANLSAEFGIINGTQGRVEALLENEVRIRVRGGLYRIRPLIRQAGQGGHSRSQIPLVEAHALTIHRAQGTTLDAVVLHGQDLFCSGQAYVAMSRVRSLDHLFLRKIPESNSVLFPKEFVRPHLP